MAKKKPSSDTAKEEPTEGSEKAEGKADTKAKKPEDDGDDLHATALKQYERGFNRDRKNMDEAYFDLRFAAEERSQWDEKAYADRTGQGRPIITVNKVPQFVRQVTGDMRQMRPAIKCVPADDRATAEVADKILPGMIRYIENRSDAQGAYFNAADSQVMAGIGHWRVMTEYASADTFNQEIRIAPIEDGVAVVWDPDSILPTREDAMFCFVPVDMSRAAFEERYPDMSADGMTTVPEFYRSWFGDDHVRIAEYWYKKAAKRMLALMPDGGIDDLTDEDDDAVAEAKAKGARIEKRDGFKVCRAVISASGILEEPDEWPGRHIPIVPLIGEEIKIGREIIRRGVVRTLRGPQQLYNYAVSTQAEVVALQPKAPFIGTKKMFQDYEDQWETANSSNWPYLEFTPDPDMPGQKPERSTPALASQGLSELAQVSTADMSAVTGIYPASLGQASNETSGKAIQARQREGDTGTFVYVEAFGRAIRRTGQIILDLIPHVYDTERTIQIVGEDGAAKGTKINQAMVSEQDGISETVLNDVTVGAYHLIMEMGPSFSTMREEARDGMTTLMQTLGPESVSLVADIFAKQQDWPLADKLAKRFRMLLPPPIQAMEAEENGEQPPPMPPPPGPTPEQQMEMAKANGEHQIDQARLQLDREKLAVESKKIDAELEKARLGHTATMAGHAAGVQTAQATQDPRVDELAQVVIGLRDMVGQIIQALSAPPPQPDPMQQQGPPPMEGGPMLEIPPEQQAPLGAFSAPGAM